MINDNIDSWKKFLNPKLLKTNLIKCSIYIVFFEKLKESIIEKIRDFYWAGYRDGKDIIDEQYKKRFYKKGVDIFDESLNWLIEHKTINKTDKHKIIKLKNHRNEIAHEMMNFITSIDKEVDESLLLECYEILSKIDKWWIIEVELPTNSDLMKMDPASIDYDGISSGNMLLLQLLYMVYTGNDESLKEIYEKVTNIRN
ncbi:MAG TPA: hypothetical protein PLS49_07925 [Candidatus Woesebacteria bacterium]|nr:hypothetical protein [Candidatus Woesebacteria bacterium]